jgi:hypothetical protein
MARVGDDEDLSLWQREVERPYPGVPRTGDSVFLGEDDKDAGLLPDLVADVAWDNDGAVMLSFDLSAMPPGVAAHELQALGFARL